MKTYIALLRGINVGGKNTLPMKELVAILEGLGARNIKTYIQSGNAVFESQENIPHGFQKRSGLKSKTADSSMKVKSAQLDISADDAATLKSSATLTIQGSLVKIN